jgi:hypothetical protein
MDGKTTRNRASREIPIWTAAIFAISLNPATGMTGNPTATACLEWITKAEATLALTDSYTSIFHKREMINGRMSPEEIVFMKFKKPFTVYMKWTGKERRGTEVIYALGWNGGHLRAHEGGLLNIINFNLDPDGSLAMRGNRHPITDSGLEHLVRLVGRNVRRGLAAGEMVFRDLGGETVYGRRARKLEGVFLREPGRGYYCYRAVLYMDEGTTIPLKMLLYDWNDALVEDYGYENTILNAGLKNADFDPKNPEYRF